jgi:hypothetical protein
MFTAESTVLKSIALVSAVVARFLGPHRGHKVFHCGSHRTRDGVTSGRDHKRPPTTTQFEPGKSGNARGRRMDEAGEWIPGKDWRRGLAAYREKVAST